MQNLINDLLDFSRVNRKGHSLEAVPLERALDAALANLKTALTESHARVTVDALPLVKADAGQLTQVFQNLVGNAIKFRGEQALEIHIGADKIEDGWRLWVRDNGMGIEPQYFERIFLLFQRLHTRSAFPGTGIGLALCKKIIERHGGKIWVESELNHGATFFFTLPER
jgi:light-regulated signal transduction histidine kinase (bacteriophytochrome)